jgi:hypothetical protein
MHSAKTGSKTVWKVATNWVAHFGDVMTSLLGVYVALMFGPVALYVFYYRTFHARLERVLHNQYDKFSNRSHHAEPSSEDQYKKMLTRGRFWSVLIYVLCCLCFLFGLYVFYLDYETARTTHKGLSMRLTIGSLGIFCTTVCFYSLFSFCSSLLKDK